MMEKYDFWKFLRKKPFCKVASLESIHNVEGSLKFTSRSMYLYKVFFSESFWGACYCRLGVAFINYAIQKKNKHAMPTRQSHNQATLKILGSLRPKKTDNWQKFAFSERPEASIITRNPIIIHIITRLCHSVERDRISNSTHSEKRRLTSPDGNNLLDWFCCNLSLKSSVN